jgi:drug/metabolite transporter superfamily protein YnfA
MSRSISVLILFAAALLESGGDAIVRFGLRNNVAWQRGLLLAAGALVLFAYGWTVNRPAWDFGKLLGVYVVFFFVIAQIISWLAFKQVPSLHVWLGGALIVVGGAIIALGN